MSWKEIAVRAAKTALQSALAVLTADALLGGAFRVGLLEQAAVAALAGAWAVVHNALLAWARS